MTVSPAGRSPAPALAIGGALAPRFEEVLTPAALDVVAALHHRFDPTRLALLERRTRQQARYDAGELPDFRPETAGVRAGDWSIADLPADLLDRRVEITGPVDRKTIIDGLNSGARVFTADFEDATAPTWTNMIEGQLHLKDRWAGAIDFTDTVSGQRHALGETPAVLVIRPRGWHLPEAHVLISGEEISGTLFDFGLYVFHNARAALTHGSGPYFCLPKTENHLEARLWSEVFSYAEAALGLAPGTIRATVLIETVPAVFEMDEILFELRDHAAGLGMGRRDYVFSFIKRLGKNPRFLTPDRAWMVMSEAFLKAYCELLVATCHRRKAFAMGGMAAQIPAQGDPAANAAAYSRLKIDKMREACLGCDGTWVAHPDLVPVAMEVFDRLMPGPDQRDRAPAALDITRDDLLAVHRGPRTAAGLAANVRVGVQYIEAWLRGHGAVPLCNAREDAATAEVARAQVWQWIHLGATLEDGRAVTAELFRQVRDEVMAKLRAMLGVATYDAGRFPEAVALFTQMSLAERFEEFLTLPAYRLIARGRPDASVDTIDHRQGALPPAAALAAVPRRGDIPSTSD